MLPNRSIAVPFVSSVTALLLLLLLTCMVCSSVADIVPSLIKSPEDQIGVSGGVASFVCQATGEPKPSITWTHRGKSVSSSQRIVVKEFDNGSGSVLRINRLRTQHEGLYECIATNRVGSYSISARLTVLEEAQTPQGFPVILVGPQLRAVEKNHTVVMTCSVTGSPDPEVSWYKDLLPLDKTNGHFKQLHDREITGALLIENSEESDEGMYECMAKNSDGTRFSQPANLYVRVRRVAPFISIPPTNQKVMPGESLNLTCVAGGEPRPYVKWMMGDKDLTEEHEITQGHNVLQLSNIRASANYTCLAASILGFTAATAQVTVTGLPRFIKPLQDQTGISGGIASFVCQARGDPKPKITWKRNGKKVTLRWQRIEVIEFENGSGSVLRIQPLHNTRDEGIYECIAANSEGQSNTSAKLTVLEGVSHGFPTFDTSPQLRAVEVTLSAIMRCSASGNPAPEISWFKDLLPLDISGSNGRIKLLSSGSLQITNSEESDQGRYECVATNSVGTRYSAPANLYVRASREVRRVPPRFSIPPTNQEVTHGGSVNLTCVAVGSPMPYVKWTVGTEDLTPEDEMPLGRNVLELTDIRESANYTCVAISSLGVIKVTAQVTVKGLPISPTYVTVTDTTATTVALTWDYEDDEPLSYVIQYKAKTSDALQEVEGVLTRHCNLDGFSPNTEYQFKIIAVNEIGRGPPSVVVETQTAESAPSSPPLRVRALTLSANEMLVQWEPPEESNGRIRAYRVYYSTDLTAPLSAWQTINTVDSRVVISGLIPNAVYSLRVLGFTSVGDGPLSDILQVKTQQGVPGKPNMMISTTGSTALIQWQPPTEMEGDLMGYQLQYKRTDDENFTSLEFKGTDDHYTVTGLHQGTTYIFRLSARNRAGIGEANMKEISTTEVKALSLQVTGLTQFSVQLTWEPPLLAEKIMYYKVIYKDMHSQQNNTVLTTDTHMTLQSLNPETTYDISVQAFTCGGAGPRSPTVQTRTKPDALLSWLSWLL